MDGLVSRKFGHYFGMYGKANTYFWTRWAISRSIVTSVVLLHLMRRGQVCPAASRRGVVGQVGKNHALFIIILAEDLVVTKEKAIANAKPAEPRKSYWSFSRRKKGSHVDKCLTCDYTVGTRNIPSGRRWPLLSSPFRKLGSLCYMHCNTQWFQRAWKNT